MYYNTVSKKVNSFFDIFQKIIPRRASGEFCGYLAFEEIHQADDQDRRYDDGQNVGHVQAHPVCHLGALAGIGFGGIILPAPAIAGDAEQGEQQRAHRQQDVIHQEVLKVHNAQAQDLHIAQHGEAQDTGHAQHHQGSTADQAGLLTIPLRQVPDAGHDILKHREDRGQGCKGHEDEEQAAPDAAASHIIEDIGQGDEHQTGAGIGFHAKGRAGREDDQACSEGHKGIQENDVDGLTHQSPFLLQVAAEDGHCANAQAQREEGLIHGCDDDIPDTGFLKLVEVRLQIEGQTFSGILQAAAVDCQQQHDAQQGQHHPLGDPLQTALQAEGADNGCQSYRENGVEAHGLVILGYRTEVICNGCGIQSGKLACGGIHKILQQPAGDGAVAHQQDDIARHSHITMDMPLAALGLQLLIHFHRALLGCAAHGKFHAHNGQTQQDQTSQINQNENRAAVLTGNIGKFPDVANTDGTSGTEQNKAQTAAKMFALHIYSSEYMKIPKNYKVFCIGSQYVF